MRRLAVIMPAYNEAERIEQTIHTIATYRRRLGVEWPVVLADDGSTDGTIQRALAAAAATGMVLRVLRYEHRGKALTVRDAMLEIAADPTIDYLMMLDADDEIRIDQLDGVEWSADPDTIYIGRRRNDNASGAPGARPRLHRRVMSAGMRFASRRMLRLSYPDTQCGFKLYPRHLAGPLFGQQRSSSWVFDAELLAIGHVVSGLPVREISVTWRPRGQSRVTAWAAISSALGIAGVAWRLWTGAYQPVTVRAPVTRPRAVT